MKGITFHPRQANHGIEPAYACRMSQMKLHQIRYLVAAAHHGSIRAAARALNVTQAAVTQGVRELEAENQLPLFIRRSSGIVLTEAGKALLQHAQIITEQMGKAEADMARLRDASSVSRLSIGVTPWVAQSLLPQVLLSFRQEMPQVQLEIFEGLSAVAHPKLRDGALDLLIARVPTTAVLSDLQVTPMFSYEAVVTGRKGHPRAREQSLSQLLDCDWLLNYTPTEEHALLHHLFGQHHLPVPHQRIHLAHSASLMLNLVRQSDMLTFCPWPLIECDGASGHLVPLPLRETFTPHTVGVLRRRHDSLSWAAQRFMAHFTEQVQVGKSSTNPVLQRVFRSLDVLV